MRIRLKGAGLQSPAIAARTQRSLEHALSKIRDSNVSPYVKHVYLYGSCARKTQTYESDVDVHVVVGNHWKSNQSLYVRNVRRGGIDVWEVR